MDNVPSITTNMPRWHSLHVHYLYRPYLLSSLWKLPPLRPVWIPVETGPLTLCVAYRSLLTAPRKQLQFTTDDITRGPADHHQRLSITAENRPPRTSLAPQVTGACLAATDLRCPAINWPKRKPATRRNIGWARKSRQRLTIGRPAVCIKLRNSVVHRKEHLSSVYAIESIWKI